MAVTAIFAAEVAIMYLVESVETGRPLGVWGEVLLDASVLSAVVVMILYLLLYRPLAAQIRSFRIADQQLRKMQDELEKRVERRAAELKKANQQLLIEARERKEALEELNYSERKYSTLVENAPSGIFIQRHGRMVFANEQLARMTGYRREELLSGDPGRLIHPDDRTRVTDTMEKRLAGKDMPEEYETRILTKSGETRWMLLRAVLINYRGGRSTLGNVVDITAAKQAEEALAESEQSLRALSSRLLTAQEDERARIARNLHDGVGQSLTAIKFAMESALLHPERPEALEALVPRMQELITEVRRISLGLRPSILDDLGLVRTLFWQGKEFAGLLPETKVEISCNVEEEEVPKPLKIVVFRIVQEALTNAAKHSGADRILVSLTAADGELELAVEDDGRGVPSRDQVLEKIGTEAGFGLTSMRERSELTGGRFSVVSAPGKGTVVRSVWPLQEPVTPA